MGSARRVHRQAVDRVLVPLGQRVQRLLLLAAEGGVGVHPHQHVVAAAGQRQLDLRAARGPEHAPAHDAGRDHQEALTSALVSDAPSLRSMRERGVTIVPAEALCSRARHAPSSVVEKKAHAERSI